MSKRASLAHVPAKVDGPGSLPQLFNDRRSGYQPFYVYSADRLSIALDGNGKITLTYVAWGSGVQNITATSCANEVIYGTGPDGTTGRSRSRRSVSRAEARTSKGRYGVALDAESRL